MYHDRPSAFPVWAGYKGRMQLRLTFKDFPSTACCVTPDIRLKHTSAAAMAQQNTKVDLDSLALDVADPAPRAPVWSQSIANPAPLGLLAFGMTTFFLMSVDTLWSGKLFVGAVMGYAYAYGGFAQMVAGVLEVR